MLKYAAEAQRKNDVQWKQLTNDLIGTNYELPFVTRFPESSTTYATLSCVIRQPISRDSSTSQRMRCSYPTWNKKFTQQIHFSWKQINELALTCLYAANCHEVVLKKNIVWCACFLFLRKRTNNNFENILTRILLRCFVLAHSKLFMKPMLSIQTMCKSHELDYYSNFISLQF